MQAIDARLDQWQSELLDLTRRNRMLNYRTSSPSTLSILEPGFDELYARMSAEGAALSFQRPLDRATDARVYSVLALMESLGEPLNVEVGDIRTAGTLLERQRVLANLRQKARLAMEEQGAGILYLSFGLLNWRDGEGAQSVMRLAPLVLMPVAITQASVGAPLMLERRDEEVMLNPTLDYMLRTTYGLELPPFDGETALEEYMQRVEDAVSARGWRVQRAASLGLLSFLKLSMYQDMERNREQMRSHPIIRALAGDTAELAPFSAVEPGFHDAQEPRDCFQVVGADSSQQDAIELSRRGVSFIMQGPPGTGKSQTITNIISQALADGRRVLFVAEKMAALQVVYRKLQDAGLSDFCLPIHSHKANKRDVLRELGRMLELDQRQVRSEALSQLDQLMKLRGELGDYARELHSPVEPLGVSPYEALGELAGLCGCADAAFDLPDAAALTRAELDARAELARLYGLARAAAGAGNPFAGVSPAASGARRAPLLSALAAAARGLAPLAGYLPALRERGLSGAPLGALEGLGQALNAAAGIRALPALWREEDYSGARLRELAADLRADVQEYARARADMAPLCREEALEADWEALCALRELELRLTGAYPRTPSELSAPYLDEEVRALKTRMDELCLRAQACCRLTGLGGDDSLGGVQARAEELDLLIEALPLPDECVLAAPDALRRELTALEALLDTQAQCRAALAGARVDPLRCDAAHRLQALTGLSDAARAAHSAGLSDDPDGLERLALMATAAREEYARLRDAALAAAREARMEMAPGGTLQPALSACQLLCALGEVPACWADTSVRAELKALIPQLRAAGQALAREHADLERDFTPTAFSIDCEALLRRFNAERASLLRVFRPGYRAARQQARDCLRAPDRSDDELAREIRRMADYRERLYGLRAQLQAHAAGLGRHMGAAGVDWDALARELAAFDSLCALMGNEQALRAAQCGPAPAERLRAALLALMGGVEAIRSIGIDIDPCAGEAGEEACLRLARRARELSGLVSSACAELGAAAPSYEAARTLVESAARLADAQAQLSAPSAGLRALLGSRGAPPAEGWSAFARRMAALAALETAQGGNLNMRTRELLLSPGGAQLVGAVLGQCAAAGTEHANAAGGTPDNCVSSAVLEPSPVAGTEPLTLNASDSAHITGSASNSDASPAAFGQNSVAGTKPVNASDSARITDGAPVMNAYSAALGPNSVAGTEPVNVSDNARVNGGAPVMNAYSAALGPNSVAGTEPANVSDNARITGGASNSNASPAALRSNSATETNPLTTSANAHLTSSASDRNASAPSASARLIAEESARLTGRAWDMNASPAALRDALDGLLALRSAGLRAFEQACAALQPGAETRALIDLAPDIERLRALRLRIREGEPLRALKALRSGGGFDWDYVANCIELWERARELAVRTPAYAPLILGTCGRGAGDALYDRALASLSAAQGARDALRAFADCFEFDIAAQEADALHARLERCAAEPARLDAQLELLRARGECARSGMQAFTAALDALYAEGGLEPDPGAQARGAYLKRFWTLWLGAAVQGGAALSGFAPAAQDGRVTAFGRLDDWQLMLARARLRQRLCEKLPGAGYAVHAGDEYALLMRELGKKQRHLPLRRLFGAIPNLLMRLKPCLMMSPLSVSYFLEAESYRFDLVIFDEASQILPQDAIGAIARGAQVIIAGDPLQLPPTRFFAASLDSAEPEDGSDDEPLYGSILECAGAALPRCMLRWHYRSRHEHLIAFSNAQIYSGGLVTFPGARQQQRDMGVEYVYVEDGVYEGQGVNQSEARRCVQLVQRHILTCPERSLGVIAFSQKQQSAIEYALERFRLSHPELEWFFSETDASGARRDEPFFIKNLENVQGDERDTIIFSIGYGKNRQGRMYMRFGPLSSEGGERRLNVAITRARYNVKLVGSILPGDIDLARTASVGARMLRDYIEFALSGTLPPGAQSAEAPAADGFADYIARELGRAGYRVARRVGCSAYKVDIALEHPDAPGAYFAGIECDGPMYMTARTVREREHLRSSVLSGMGWRLMRVWSQQFISDPQGQLAQIMDFARRALAGYAPDAPAPEPDAPLWDEEDMTRAVEPETEGPMSRYGIRQYVAADFRDAPEAASPGERLRACIMYVISVEQPLHVELLQRRLAGFFGNEKVTSNARRAIDEALQPLLGTSVERTGDGFLYLIPRPPICARMPAPGEAPRRIEHIAPDEISAAMRGIIAGTFGITPEALMSETVRALGYDRAGPRITAALEKAYARLLSDGRACLLDGKLKLTGGE